MQCVSCDSTHVIKKGFAELSTGEVRQRYKCKSCGESFSIAIIKNEPEDSDVESYQVTDDEEIGDEHQIDVIDFRYERSQEWLQQNVFSKKRLVITSAQNNTPVNLGFYDSLRTYCRYNDANLLVIPIKYKTINSQDDQTAVVYDSLVSQYLCENTIVFEKYNLKIYAGLRIQATAENPLSGLDPLSKGSTVIVGHAQVQLKTLPNMEHRISDILTTTGAITEKNYSKTKLGEKARFNHSISALVVEFDETHYHLRHLNFDEETESFWDIDRQYFAGGNVLTGEAEALITGDEHAVVRSKLVERCTYTDQSSIVNTIRPRNIIRHDTLDSFSVSHHHARDMHLQYAKYLSGTHVLRDELRKTIDYVNSTTPDFSTSYIVQSNHNEHLIRWCREANIALEIWNYDMYHFLNNLISSSIMESHLDNLSKGIVGELPNIPDPFQMIAKDWLKENVKFIDRTGMKIKGIEVGMHGDVGVNGARGSAKSFARMPDKMVVGHSHSPSIEKGCYTVGTSSNLKLEYNRGASTWHHAHVIIHPNGKRQMIFITPDGWRLD